MNRMRAATDYHEPAASFSSRTITLRISSGIVSKL
jgi:hypothetical protein